MRRRGPGTEGDAMASGFVPATGGGGTRVQKVTLWRRVLYPIAAGGGSGLVAWSWVMDRTALDALFDLASRQHGLVSSRQMAQLGITERSIRTAVERGWLRRERRGVFAVAGLPPSKWRQVAAAALAAGPDAVISHRQRGGNPPLLRRHRRSARTDGPAGPQLSPGRCEGPSLSVHAPGRHRGSPWTVGDGTDSDLDRLGGDCPRSSARQDPG